MSDLTLKCIDCHSDFVFSEAEQTFYEERQYSKPKRCRLCRPSKRAQFAEQDAGRKK
jgi:hypothetical protein